LYDAPPPSPPRSRDAAEARVSQLESNGGVPLLGLLPVPPSWASAFGRSVADLFDGCTNIAIGTAMMSNFAQQCVSDANPRSDRARALAPQRSADAKAARRRRSRSLVSASADGRQCVLRKYGEAINFVGLYEFVSLELSFQQARDLYRGLTAKAQESPIFAEGPDTPWGPDRIFFQVAASPVGRTGGSPGTVSP
jgi:hypothetical protein